MENKIITIVEGGVTKIYNYAITECLYKGVKAYGISIVRKDIENEIIVKEVSDSVHLVTPNRDKALALLNKLYDGMVSPIHLVDVICEYVDLWVNEFDKIDELQPIN